MSVSAHLRRRKLNLRIVWTEFSISTERIALKTWELCVNRQCKVIDLPFEKNQYKSCVHARANVRWKRRVKKLRESKPAFGVHFKPQPVETALLNKDPVSNTIDCTSALFNLTASRPMHVCMYAWARSWREIVLFLHCALLQLAQCLSLVKPV